VSTHGVEDSNNNAYGTVDSGVVEAERSGDGVPEAMNNPETDGGTGGTSEAPGMECHFCSTGDGERVDDGSSSSSIAHYSYDSGSADVTPEAMNNCADDATGNAHVAHEKRGVIDAAQGDEDRVNADGRAWKDHAAEATRNQEGGGVHDNARAAYSANCGNGAAQEGGESGRTAVGATGEGAVRDISNHTAEGATGSDIPES